MITYIYDVNDQVKIEVSLDNQEKLPEPPDGFEWIDVSCVDDHLRGFCVFLLGVVLK